MLGALPNRLVAFPDMNGYNPTLNARRGLPQGEETFSAKVDVVLESIKDVYTKPAAKKLVARWESNLFK